MAFCNHCGRQVSDESTVCNSCGSPLPSGHTASHRFAFHGDGGALLGIYVVNFLLSAVTLGIYWFWGRTKVRKYLASSIDLSGDRFAYHGTGGELFIGWLKGFALLIVMLAQLFACMALFGQERGSIVGMVVLYLALFVLIPIAMVGAWRYRLTRTSYRGIRFSFRGKIGTLAGIYYGGLVLTVLTLGIYYPYFADKLQRYFVTNSAFGDQSFGFDGEGKDMLKPWIIALLLLLPTLGLSSFWFAVKQTGYYFNHTTFGAARFRANFTFGGVIGLMITNYLLIVFTFFIGFPWALVRSFRYLFDNLTIEGDLGLEAVRQRAMGANATGEGLVDVLDLGGTDLGFGM